MVTLLGLGPLLQLQRPQDDERIKMGQLFKAYYPVSSYELERTSAFYELSLDQLRRKMISLERGMEKIFNKYLDEQPDLMVKEEIYPGESIWTVGDLNTQLKERGALGFVASLGIQHLQEQEAVERLKSIIKNGALSTMERFRANMSTLGQSSTTDITHGSCTEVFSRVLTKANMADYDITSGVHVLFDLSIANRVSYAWLGDNYGSKAGWEYRERKSFQDLLDHNPKLDYNEHMSKKRVQPEKLRFVLSKSLKEALIEALSKDGLIEEREGKKHIKVSNELIPADEMLLENRGSLNLEMF